MAFQAFSPLKSFSLSSMTPNKSAWQVLGKLKLSQAGIESMVSQFRGKLRDLKDLYNVLNGFLFCGEIYRSIFSVGILH